MQEKTKKSCWRRLDKVVSVLFPWFKVPHEKACSDMRKNLQLKKILAFTKKVWVYKWANIWYQKESSPFSSHLFSALTYPFLRPREYCKMYDEQWKQRRSNDPYSFPVIIYYYYFRLCNIMEKWSFILVVWSCSWSAHDTKDRIAFRLLKKASWSWCRDESNW